jgi:endonuclease G
MLMARRETKSKPPKPGWPLGLLLAICVLLLVSGALYFAYLQTKEHERRQLPEVAGEPPRATQSGPAPPFPGPDQPSSAPELVSDDRVIFGGMPRPKNPLAGTLNVTVLKNKAYTVGFSPERKVPMWAAYRVIRKENPFILERPRGDFLQDTRIGVRLTHQDYTGSGYDRGHMTPNSAIARCFGLEAQRETFLMTNICPQSPNLNQKVWENLERAELDYANRFGEVWVVDGPIFPGLKGGTEGQKTAKKLRSGVHVPDSFFKILVHDASGGRGLKVEACAVIMPQNVRGTEPASQFTRTIGEVEESTGLEFLWQLPPEVQARIKSKNAALWPARAD